MNRHSTILSDPPISHSVLSSSSSTSPSPSNSEVGCRLASPTSPTTRRRRRRSETQEKSESDKMSHRGRDEVDVSDDLFVSSSFSFSADGQIPSSPTPSVESSSRSRMLIRRTALAPNTIGWKEDLHHEFDNTTPPPPPPCPDETSSVSCSTAHSYSTNGLPPCIPSPSFQSLETSPTSSAPRSLPPQPPSEISLHSRSNSSKRLDVNLAVIIDSSHIPSSSPLSSSCSASSLPTESPLADALMFQLDLGSPVEPEVTIPAQSCRRSSVTMMPRPGLPAQVSLDSISSNRSSLSYNVPPGSGWSEYNGSTVASALSPSYSSMDGMTPFSPLTQSQLAAALPINGRTRSMILPVALKTNLDDNRSSVGSGKNHTHSDSALYRSIRGMTPNDGSNPSLGGSTVRPAHLGRSNSIALASSSSVSATPTANSSDICKHSHLSSLCPTCEDDRLEAAQWARLEALHFPPPPSIASLKPLVAPESLADRDAFVSTPHQRSPSYLQHLHSAVTTPNVNPSQRSSPHYPSPRAATNGSANGNGPSPQPPASQRLSSHTSAQMALLQAALDEHNTPTSTNTHVSFHFIREQPSNVSPHRSANRSSRFLFNQQPPTHCEQDSDRLESWMIDATQSHDQPVHFTIHPDSLSIAHTHNRRRTAAAMMAGTHSAQSTSEAIFAMDFDHETAPLTETRKEQPKQARPTRTAPLTTSNNQNYEAILFDMDL